MKKLQLKKIIRESIKKLINEQITPVPPSNSQSNNQQVCFSLLLNTPKQSFRTKMENITASPGGCQKIMQKHMQLEQKLQPMKNPSATTWQDSICTGSTPKHAAQLFNRTLWMDENLIENCVMNATACNNDHYPC